MEILKKLLTPELKEAIAWGEKHAKEMASKECPFDFFDDEFEYWQLAQEAKRLQTLSVEEQEFQLAANLSIQAKMNS